MSDTKELIKELNERLKPHYQVSDLGNTYITNFTASKGLELCKKEVDLYPVIQGAYNAKEKSGSNAKNKPGFNAKNIYVEIFWEISKGENALSFTPKLDVTFDKCLTPEQITIEDTTYHYGEIKLGETTVLYILRLQSEHIQSL